MQRKAMSDKAIHRLTSKRAWERLMQILAELGYCNVHSTFRHPYAYDVTICLSEGMDIDENAGLTLPPVVSALAHDQKIWIHDGKAYVEFTIYTSDETP